MTDALAHAPAESSRFGLRVLRGNMVDSIDERSILATLLTDEADVAILRGPAPLHAHGMSRYGMAAIHADTLVYHQCDFATTTARELRNRELEFSIATDDDADALRALVITTFDGYRCHYHANPLFSPSDILDGYVEWAMGHVGVASAGRTTWVARREGRVVAFACCADDGVTGEGVLYGVHPDHAGGGLYTDLIRYTQRVFAERGRAAMRVSTQVWNHAVQKVWAREGFWLQKSLDTWHVNALLSAGELLADREVVFSDAQVREFARISGDANPLHLDEAVARQAGFAGTLTHGMLAGAELSRLFGMEVPGAGTLFLRCSLSFLHPILSGRPHRLVVRAMPRPPGRARLAVATLRDEAERHCVLAYSDLLKR